MLKDEFNNFSIRNVKPRVGLKLDNAEVFHISAHLLCYFYSFQFSGGEL